MARLETMDTIPLDEREKSSDLLSDHEGIVRTAPICRADQSIATLAEHFQDGVPVVVVIDELGGPLGTVRGETLLVLADAREAQSMQTTRARDVAGPAPSVGNDATVDQAIRAAVSAGSDHVLVCNSDGALAGLSLASDLLAARVRGRKPKPLNGTRLSELIQPLFTVEGTASAATVARRFVETGSRALFVVGENAAIEGVVLPHALLDRLDHIQASSEDIAEATAADLMKPNFVALEASADAGQGVEALVDRNAACGTVATGDIAVGVLWPESLLDHVH